jgi:thiol:disulfide interchange protein DsbD
VKSVLLALLIVGCGCQKDPPKAAPSTPATAEPGPKASAHDAASQVPATAVELSWFASEPEALAAAKKANKPVFIDVTARWCAPCMQLEKQTFTVPAVAARLARDYVLLRIDVTEQSDETEALQNKYGAEVLPVLLVVAPDGTERGRINQFVDSDELLSALDGF